MNESEYIKSRIDDQLNWYERKSAINKKIYQRCQFLLLIFAGLITLSAFIKPDGDHKEWLITVPILGALIALITGVVKIYKFQENWTAYRSTAELLKFEKFMFMTKTQPYNGPDAFNVLVQRVEGLISKENSQWTQYTSQSEEQ